VKLLDLNASILFVLCVILWFTLLVALPIKSQCRLFNTLVAHNGRSEFFSGTDVLATLIDQRLYFLLLYG
jgi:hypothetical protein